jgi:hypothetical protein
VNPRRCDRPAHESVGVTCLGVRIDVEAIDVVGRRAKEVFLFRLGVGGDAPRRDWNVVTEPVQQRARIRVSSPSWFGQPSKYRISIMPR